MRLQASRGLLARPVYKVGPVVTDHLECSIVEGWQADTENQVAQLPILLSVLQWVQQTVGSVSIFGSHAYGLATASSDYDLCVDQAHSQ